MSQFPRRPMRHGPSRILGGFAGHRDELRQLFRRKVPGGTRARRIVEPRLNLGVERLVVTPSSLGCVEVLSGSTPAFTPRAYRIAIEAELLGNLRIARAFGGSQNGLSPPDKPLWARLAAHQALQKRALCVAQRERKRLWTWHDWLLLAMRCPLLLPVSNS